MNQPGGLDELGAAGRAAWTRRIEECIADGAQPAHRSGWVSLYAPLAKGQIDEGDARELLVRYPSAEDRPAMYAVDVSRPGHAAMLRRAQGAAISTTLLATPQANPSSSRFWRASLIERSIRKKAYALRREDETDVFKYAAFSFKEGAFERPRA